jgi:uncharacterized protein (TIGR02246 family)
MKRQLLVALLIIGFASIAEAQDSLKADIEANNKKFVEAFNKGDAAAVASMYASDARVLPPNADIIKGPADIQKYWGGAIAAGMKMPSLVIDHVERMGEYALEIGRYTLTIPGAGGATNTDKGKYVVVWKKEGGNWKIAVDTFNTSLPATASP